MKNAGTVKKSVFQRGPMCNMMIIWRILQAKKKVTCNGSIDKLDNV
jgi:hypothetical protein